MDYLQKAEEIYDAIDSIGRIDENKFPLLWKMTQDKRARKEKYFARINSNLMLYGKSKLSFEDIDY